MCVRVVQALVDCGIDQTQVVHDAPGCNHTLAGLPDLVVDHVDAVVVIGGQLAPRVTVEQGRGAELLARGGVYAKLFTSGKFPT